MCVQQSNVQFDMESWFLLVTGKHILDPKSALNKIAALPAVNLIPLVCNECFCYHLGTGAGFNTPAPTFVHI